jgi:hypothetical protein
MIFSRTSFLAHFDRRALHIITPSFARRKFAFDNFRTRLLSFRARQRHRTSCPQQRERVLIHRILVSKAAKGAAENQTVSVLSQAFAGMPLGQRHQ